VDSNRNFIISGYVNTLQGRVETKVRESVNFKSRHNFNVNANTDIQDAVRTSTVESTTTTREGLLTTTVQRHVSYPLMADFHLWLTGRCSEKQVTTIDRQLLARDTTDLNDLPHRREQNEQR
jgi:hypothetical protein